MFNVDYTICNSIDSSTLVVKSRSGLATIIRQQITPTNVVLILYPLTSTRMKLNLTLF